jgi:hypothetical protein
MVNRVFRRFNILRNAEIIVLLFYTITTIIKYTLLLYSEFTLAPAALGGATRAEPAAVLVRPRPQTFPRPTDRCTRVSAWVDLGAKGAEQPVGGVVLSGDAFQTWTCPRGRWSAGNCFVFIHVPPGCVITFQCFFPSF